MKCDKKTFAEILDKHRGIIRKVSMLYTSNREDQEDLFQEICFQICRSYNTFRDEAQLSTWLYRVALNTAISQVRKNKQKTPSETFYENIHYASVRNEDGEGQVQQLFKAISMLNKIDKALILLWLEEKNYEEIADILGISKSNVSVKLVRIKRNLSETINGLKQ
jgi:RNA polymerase sigma-70 factor (ECF subfamily)